MKAHDFPNCCTAKILTGFGGTLLQENGPYDISKKKMEVYLDEQEKVQRLEGKAVVVIATNSQQKRINSVLRQKGYTHSKWMNKSQHPETKVRIWHKALN